MGSNTSSKRKRGAAIAATLMLAEAGGLWARTGRPAGNVIVRCRQGHLFTTLWVPGASLKAVRLGWWRFQRCPVGDHWSWVTPVKESSLSSRELRAARKQHDIRVP
ncbi:MAG: hypothetical protein JO304_13635 [Solirubrobacterales bacterium]|nr:hypothetical protein [Solirubrobacterales bacterium]